ncbi:MAG: AEC family transporter [Treponemataceae bacterium]
MFGSFMAVLQQVVILYLLIAVGFICGKTKMFSKESIKNLSNFVLFFVTPCLTVTAFNRDFNREMFRGLLITFIAAIGVHIFNIIMAHICIHEKNENREKVLRFAAVFSNCGFMAIPLQQSLLGDDAVFYSGAYIGIFNVVSWTYGAVMMSKERNVSLSHEDRSKQIKLYAKKCFLNPGVIGVVAGLFVFFLPIQLPKIIASPIASLAALNTPVPMVIIGFYLSEITNFEVLKKFYFWLNMLLRLIVSPLCFIAVLYFLGIKGMVFEVLAIASCTPVAANTVMFSTLFNRDTVLASELVSISTLFSIITMPIIVTLMLTLA